MTDWQKGNCVLESDGRLNRMAGSAKPVEAPQLHVALDNPPRGLLGDVPEAFPLSILVAGAMFLVQWRYGFNWGDEGLLWYISQRTALGQIPLRDFFSYDPGRYYWSAAVFKFLRGDGLFEQIVANDVFGLFGLIAAYIAMSRAGMSRRWCMSVLFLLGVALGFPRHKIFEQTLSLLAVVGIAFVMARPMESRRWLLYGIATGLAAFIGRNSGLYFVAAGLLLLFLLRLSGSDLAPGRALFANFLGMTLGYSPMLFMLCCVRGFALAFYRSILFTPNWQLKLAVPFPWHLHLKGLHGIDALQEGAVSMLCLAVPIAYLCMVLGWLRHKGEGDNALRLACAASVAGLPYLHQAFSRADFFHIAQSILPVVVGIGAVARHFWNANRRRLSISVFSCSAILVLTAWLPYEPMIQFVRARTQDPRTVQQIEIQGKRFYVTGQQADLMHTVQSAFRNCGSQDGSFLAAPYYPGLYAFLKTRAPFWELYYLYHRSDEFQERHIAALEGDHTSLVLLNREAAVDGRESLRIGHTYPKLVDFILTHYQRMDTNLPEGFELYYLPQGCRSQP
jgi:hypothetical protein